MLPAVLVRPATPRDARALAEVSVASWRSAYAGLLPQALLDSLSVAAREEGFRRLLAVRLPRSHVLVAETDGVAGFVIAGPARDEPPDTALGEARALHVRPDRQGLGMGRALLGGACAALARGGFGQIVLWVLRGNTRARRFYEAVGWQADGGTRLERWHGAELEEVRYRRPLDSLRGAAELRWDTR